MSVEIPRWLDQRGLKPDCRELEKQGDQEVEIGSWHFRSVPWETFSLNTITSQRNHSKYFQMHSWIYYKSWQSQREGGRLEQGARSSHVLAKPAEIWRLTFTSEVRAYHLLRFSGLCHQRNKVPCQCSKLKKKKKRIPLLKPAANRNIIQKEIPTATNKWGPIYT